MVFRGTLFWNKGVEKVKILFITEEVGGQCPPASTLLKGHSFWRVKCGSTWKHSFCQTNPFDRNVIKPKVVY